MLHCGLLMLTFVQMHLARLPKEIADRGGDFGPPRMGLLSRARLLMDNNLVDASQGRIEETFYYAHLSELVPLLGVGPLLTLPDWAGDAGVDDGGGRPLGAPPFGGHRRA